MWALLHHVLAVAGKEHPARFRLSANIPGEAHGPRRRAVFSPFRPGIAADGDTDIGRRGGKSGALLAG